MSNELIERYLYDVIRRLPEKQKKDIEQELKTLIEDMIEERMEGAKEGGAGDYEACVKAVLSELGSPAKLARRYRGENECLISGEYFDSYCFVMKIVLVCVSIGIVLSGIISAVVHVVETEGMVASMWNDVVNIGNLPFVLIQAFGTITLIYAVLERNHVKITANEAVWTLDKLPQIPYKKAVISRGESAVGIVFGVLVIIMFIFVPQLMGVWVKQGEMMVAIPLFNINVWNKVLPLFVICFITGIANDLVKLIVGRYNYTVMAVTIVMDIVAYILTVIIFKVFPVWNANFVSELEAAFDTSIQSRGDILFYFNTDVFTNGILIFALVFMLVDIGVTVYRAVRYSQKQ